MTASDKRQMIDARTWLYCVLGNPVSHSLSPVMHNTAFEHIGHKGVYLAFGVKNIASAIAGIKSFDIKGASITIPHKVSVLEHLDEIDEQSQKIGAVNTIVNRDGVLCGYNSDCTGAIKALSEATTINGRRVAIIGAGGAARAIGYGILSAGGILSIVNRSVQKGENLARDLGSEFFPQSEFRKLGFDILINTTPVGMTPNIEDMPVHRENIQPEMTVMDIIYNPLKTRLLRTAEEIGCRTIDGLTMFVYQGVIQFELWTAKKAPIDVMRRAVKNALKENERD
ncbi:shikimate dehydrogenase [Thermodesulfobacteriota bacterium]